MRPEADPQPQASADDLAASKLQHTAEADHADAPYSFRRNRRMNLQPQAAAPASSSAEPAAGHSAKATQRIKIKRHSAEAQEAAPAAASAPDAVAADATAAETQQPVRTSVRVKIKRTASGSRVDAANPVEPDKQPANKHSKKSKRHKRHKRTTEAQPQKDDTAAAGPDPEADESAEAAHVDSSLRSRGNDLSELQLPSQHSAKQNSAGDQGHELDEADSAMPDALQLSEEEQGFESGRLGIGSEDQEAIEEAELIDNHNAPFREWLATESNAAVDVLENVSHHQGKAACSNSSHAHRDQPIDILDGWPAT